MPYRRRARAIVFAAVLFANAGLAGILKPSTLEKSAVAGELGQAAQTLWLFLFAVGGVLVIAGVYWPKCPRPDVEAAGLWPLIAGCAIYLVTVIIIGATVTIVPILGLAIWTLHGRLLDLYDARDRVGDRRILAERFKGEERRSGP